MSKWTALAQPAQSCASNFAASILVSSTIAIPPLSEMPRTKRGLIAPALTATTNTLLFNKVCSSLSKLYE